MDVFSYFYIVSFFTLRPSHTFCFSLLFVVCETPANASSPKVYLLDPLQCVEPSPQMLLQLHWCGLILVLAASGEGNRVLPSKGKVTSCLPLLCQHIGLPSVEVGCVWSRLPEPCTLHHRFTLNIHLLERWREPGWQLKSVGKNLQIFPETLVSSAQLYSLLFLFTGRKVFGEITVFSLDAPHWKSSFWTAFWSFGPKSCEWIPLTLYFKPLDLCFHEWTFFSNLRHHFFLVYHEQE